MKNEQRRGKAHRRDRRGDGCRNGVWPGPDLGAGGLRHNTTIRNYNRIGSTQLVIGVLSCVVGRICLSAATHKAGENEGVVGTVLRKNKRLFCGKE